MNTSIIKEYVNMIAVALLIILFSFTGLNKILNHHEFTAAMYKQPLPNWLIACLNVALPYIELSLALALLARKTRTRAIFTSTVLMVLFTAYITLGLVHAFKHVPCSCGGPIKNMSWVQHLLFNFLVISICILSMWTNTGHNKKKLRKNRAMLNPVKFTLNLN